MAGLDRKRLDILRAAIESADHFTDRFFRNLQGRSLPAGVDGADDPSDGIDQKYRHAVRRFDAKRQSRPVRHDGVKGRGSVTGEGQE